MTKKEEFYLDVPKHVELVRGFLEALSWLTISDGFQLVYHIYHFELPVENIGERITQDTGIEIDELTNEKKFIGHIEKDFKEMLTKNILGGEYDKNSKIAQDHIEGLVWHIAEYIDWFNGLTSTCYVEKARILNSDDDSDFLYAFTVNNKYAVIFIKQNKPIEP